MGNSKSTAGSKKSSKGAPDEFDVGNESGSFKFKKDEEVRAEEEAMIAGISRLEQTEADEKKGYWEIPTDLDTTGADPDVVSCLAISDTHSMHAEMDVDALPKVDILIHGGDFSNVGHFRDCKAIDDWIGSLLKKGIAKKAVLIAGNHDVTLDKAFYLKRGQKRFHGDLVEDPDKCKKTVEKHSIYLEDSSVNLFGINIYGSPYSPEFCDWAFGLPRGKALAKVWKKIPLNTDILVTHGPLYGHGDEVIAAHAAHPSNGAMGAHVGCKALSRRVKEMVDQKSPMKFHVYGHIHEGYGITQDVGRFGKDLHLINASSVNVRYKMVHKPILFWIKKHE